MAVSLHLMYFWSDITAVTFSTLRIPRSVEKSWASFYAILKSNTLYFYKDVKHFKRNEFESACDITTDAVIDLEPDKKGIKLIKISKPNGLEMLLRVKTEVSSTFCFQICKFSLSVFL